MIILHEECGASFKTNTFLAMKSFKIAIKSTWTTKGALLNYNFLGDWWKSLPILKSQCYVN